MGTSVWDAPDASKCASPSAATNAPATIAPTAVITARDCRFPTAKYSAVIVNAAVVRRSVVYIGRFTPRTDDIDSATYAK
jgi:hypothetical protein